MLESIEKLRTAARNMAKGRNLENHEECNLLLIIADEIEREISERYMLLPVDENDVPIRVGEVVLDYETPRSVVAVTPNAIVMDGYEDGDSIRIGYAVNHPHVKPRTLHDALQSFREACYKAEIEHGEHPQHYDIAMSNAFRDCEREIRELLGGDAE